MKQWIKRGIEGEGELAADEGSKMVAEKLPAVFGHTSLCRYESRCEQVARKERKQEVRRASSKKPHRQNRAFQIHESVIAPKLQTVSVFLSQSVHDEIETFWVQFPARCYQ